MSALINSIETVRELRQQNEANRIKSINCRLLSERSILCLQIHINSCHTNIKRTSEFRINSDP